MTSSLAKCKQTSGAHLKDDFLTFLNIPMYFIILNTNDEQFTLTTKKTLHLIFKELDILVLHETGNEKV